MKNGEYIMIVAPHDYPGKKYRGKYCYEHHLEYWKFTAIVPSKGENIHHIDHNKSNNHISNLLLLDAREHRRLHGILQGRKISSLKCQFCGVDFVRETRQIKAGQTNFFCCRSHQVTSQQLKIKNEKLNLPNIAS